MTKLERTDRLRRRPEYIRYYYMAVSNTTVHTGISYGGLDYAKRNHGIQALFLADLQTKKVIEVTEPVEAFMLRWRLNYNNTEWDYSKDLELSIPAPKGE